MSSKENDIVCQILKEAETRCLKCCIFDAVAKEHNKRGVCEKCFNEFSVAVDLPYDPKEF